MKPQVEEQSRVLRPPQRGPTRLECVLLGVLGEAESLCLTALCPKQHY